MPSFVHIKEGDEVVRLLAGTIPMPLTVVHVDDTFIYCGAPFIEGEEYAGWMFERRTGAEIDHDLGWGTQYGITGSYLES